MSEERQSKVMRVESVEAGSSTGQGGVPRVTVNAGGMRFSYFEDKLAALAAHASQITDITSVASFVREWAAETARRFGLPPGRLAEAFQVVDTR